MDMLIEQFFNLSVMWQSLPMILHGIGVALLLCIIVIPTGILGGLGVALLCLSKHRMIRVAAIVFVDFFRAIPPLVLLIFVYSGLPFLGIRLDPMSAVVVAFFLNNTAYYAEVHRAGINSVARGQREAAVSTGLTRWQTFFWIILPQAVRNVLPDLISNTIEVVKLTSLASVVSLAEILYAANMARSVTYNASPLVLAAVVYLILIWPMVRLVSRFERRAQN